MYWFKIGATHYYAQLGLSDKVRVIKGLVVCYVVWSGFMKGMGLRCTSLVPCCGKEGYRV